MRKTKIICTLGPATEKPETIKQLIAHGADVFRLNMSHASADWVREIVPRIRQLADQLKRPIGILLDTQGPAIRTGAACTRFCVNTPAADAGVSETMRPRSSFLFLRIPA